MIVVLIIIVLAFGGAANFFIDDSLWGYLAEHFQRIEPRFHFLEPHLLVNMSDGNAFDFNGSLMCFCSDLFAFTIWSPFSLEYNLNGVLKIHEREEKKGGSVRVCPGL